MSNSLAIAAVSQLIVEQVGGSLPDFLGINKFITVGPPQLMREGRTDPQINLFLYQLNPDAAWRNQVPPNKPQASYPLLALKLHYLVTAFGNENDDIAAHRMLGAVMLQFHNHPVLSIQGTAKDIADSHLADQYESVRLTLQPLSLDEATKLWSGFQSPYRLSVAYEASVILIESGKPARSAPPVLNRGGSSDSGFDASTLGAEPTIQMIDRPFGLSGPQLAPPATATWIQDELVLVGQNLDHPDLRIVFSHPKLKSRYIAKVTGAIEQSSSRLRVRLPHGLTTVEEDLSKSLNDMENAPVIAPTMDRWPAGVYTVAAARGVRKKIEADPNPPLDRVYSTSPVALAVLPQVQLPLTGDLSLTDANAALKVILISKLVLVGGQIAHAIKLFVGPIELVGDIQSPDGLELNWDSQDKDNIARLKAGLRQIPADGRFLRVQVDGVDSSLLSPPADSSSLPPKTFDTHLLVNVVGL